MDQEPKRNGSAKRLAVPTKTLPARGVPGDFESKPASSNATESLATRRWLGETPDKEHWNAMARAKESLRKDASKM
jgi:hypothetical protein